MIRHTVIDHILRRQLGLTCLQYIIIDAIMQGCDNVDELSRETGIQESTLKQSIDNLYQFVTEDFTLTQEFLSAYDGGPIPEKKKRESAVNELPGKVIDLFNKINDTRYKVDTYYSSIVKIQKKIGDDIDKYHSVILHKNLTWGKDEKMEEYNRPSTIFRNPDRFKQYLDEATLFWNKKEKNNYVELGL
jgi:uncharacterized phage protein (TIGR02220 family)